MIARSRSPLLLSIMFALLSYGCSSEPSALPPADEIESGSVLESVQARGFLNCGVSGDLAGFSNIDLESVDITTIDNDDASDLSSDLINRSLTGFDVDICKAIAVAIFNDPEAVKFRLLDTQERFEELTSGRIDVLSRSTTWTLARDVSINIEFAPIVFYDGQGVMVRKDSNIKSLQDLRGKDVCVQIETTNQANVQDEMRKLGINYQLRPLGSQREVYSLYEAGECQAVTADRSQLAGVRTTLGNPDDHILLPEIISKEPLAPAVLEGDMEWLEIVRWVVFSLIEAEELGVNQRNLEEKRNSLDPRVIRFLGSEEVGDSIGARLKLSPNFTQNIIREVGNYGDIYERNLGENSSTYIERDLNNLWSNPEKSGLLYSPPF
ncbi:MAG: amino acid ABC transporter substrate-binding protein [Phormidesmis sp.]